MSGYSGYGGNNEMSGYSGYGRNNEVSGYSGYGRNNEVSGYSGYGRNNEVSGYSGYGRNNEVSGYSGFGGNTKAKYNAFIAARTRKVEVDQRLSIKLYYRMANNLLKQASIYRDENSVLDLYILLVRFTSLLTETIPSHRDYQLFVELKLEYRKRLMQILNELEALKPEVLKHFEYMNPAHQSSVPPSQDVTYNQSLARPTYSRNQSQNGSTVQKDYGLSISSSRRDYLNRPTHTESPVFNPSYLDDPTSGMSFSIPRARDETLSRHSLLNSVSQTTRRSPPVRPLQVQYPHHIDTSPIELPSLQQGWGTSQAARTSRQLSALEASSSIWPKSSETVYTTDPNLLSLVRQPSPPPEKASVHTLHINHEHPQLRPSQVADPRPGPPRGTEFDFPESKRRKLLHVSSRLLEEFLKLAELNTQQNLETCGVLTGSLKNGAFKITTLIIPKQKSTPDTCETLNEEELFDIQDQRGLFQLGWIHTHPKQTCFMSSVDLHTHYSYQIMLPEAIAIVMAPTDTNRRYGIFRLSDPGGVQVLQNCQQRGFHQHEEPLEGGPIYETSSHVEFVDNLRYDIVDLR